VPAIGDPYAVDLGAIGAAQIFNKPTAGLPRQPSVMTRDLWIVNDHVTIVPTPKEKAWGQQLEILSSEALGLAHQT